MGLSGNSAFIIQMVLIVIVFYFVIIRPQKKTQEEHKKMIAGLKKNDEVITAGGIHGTIMNVKDNTVTVKVDDNVKIEVQKSSVMTMKRQASV